jgi:hypothetical protein
VCDLAPRDGPHGIRGQRYEGYRLSAQRDELDLIRLAVSMHENDGAEIALAELRLGACRG